MIAGKQEAEAAVPRAGKAARSAFRQGITSEAFSPKTALFFLSFLPQFVNREAPVIPQFLLLGTVSVTLNTTVDVVVALLAGPIGSQLRRRPRLRHGQRYASGGALLALGAYVAVSGERR